MSDTTDLMGARPDADASDAAAAPAAPARRRRSAAAGLDGLVLAELQKLATGLGISGTGRMRKSQLIEAIKEKSGGDPLLAGGAAPAPAAKRTTAKAAAAAPAEEAPAAPAAEEKPPAAPVPPPPLPPPPRSSRRPRSRSPSRPPPRPRRRTERTRRRATSAAGAPAAEAAAEQAGTVVAEAKAETRTAEQRPAEGETRTERRDRRDRRDRREGGERTEAAAEGQDAEGRESRRDRRNRRDRDRAERQPGQGQQQAGTQQDSQAGRQGQPAGQQAGGYDDDEFGDGRRGRRGRYRDRRGRGRREGFEGGTPEPQIGEDDVLIPVAGILDILDNYAFVRTSGYLPGQNDVYVSLAQVRKHGLRKGDAITGAVRQPRDGERREKFNAMVRLDSVNGMDPDGARNRPEFGKLTPLYPQERLRLETDPGVLTTRIIDLVSPIGKGQRGLIVAPPKTGKTMIMQAIANAITHNNPECHLMVVLVDERPEEVTDMQRSVKGEVISSTFDRPAEDHTTVAELAIERAKRLVELGHDVVILLDSITRLGRAYNLAALPPAASCPVVSTRPRSTRRRSSSVPRATSRTAAR
ncbi:transcription termination factor Rho [Kitasatospora arboriphila]